MNTSAQTIVSNEVILKLLRQGHLNNNDKNEIIDKFFLSFYLTIKNYIPQKDAIQFAIKTESLKDMYIAIKICMDLFPEKNNETFKFDDLTVTEKFKLRQYFEKYLEKQLGKFSCGSMEQSTNTLFAFDKDEKKAEQSRLMAEQIQNQDSEGTMSE